MGGCVFVLTHVQLFATPWTVVCQDPLSMEIPNPGIKSMSLVSPCIDRWILHHCTTWEAHRRQIHGPKHSGTQTTECVYLLHDSISLF